VNGFQVFGVPVEFILFGLTLLGIALFHNKVLPIALAGSGSILAYKLAFTEFDLGHHAAEEWELLLNLFGLLVGFTVLSGYFAMSKIPDWLPHVLPDDWKGGFALLVATFVLSSFLDNIAAAIIGATVAGTVFAKKVHIGFLAALVAASNAGGAGSVVGDTTTTMIWLAGVSPLEVLHAYVAAGTALLVFAGFASVQQDRYQRIQKYEASGLRIDFGALVVVAAILAGAILANVYLDHRPALGVWAAILLAMPFKEADWHEVPAAIKGAIFLLALVFAASLMPVESLPAASASTAFGLGAVSAVFDNIPLTKLAIEQNGYDWGCLAYTVGFGGSMIWFGSSAGVAVCNLYPEARSVGAWLKGGWHVALAYVLGFLALYFALGWQPHPI
jgi:Na+/H+ antiporter NhaD/arsenite permease-like protein